MEQNLMKSSLVPNVCFGCNVWQYVKCCVHLQAEKSAFGKVIRAYNASSHD